MPLAPEYYSILPAWLTKNPALADQWVSNYIEAGGDANGEFASKAATKAVRESDGYKAVFPAMFDDEGNMRFVSDPEATYDRTMESYRNTLRSYDVNPEIFNEQLHSLIEGAVSAGEFTQRTEAVYENVIESAPAIREWYATNFAKDMTDQAIFASLIDGPQGPVSLAILSDNITMAQIGGEAEQRGFNVDLSFADMLEDSGMTREGAQGFFGQAASLLPTLSILAQRHEDPDDEFDINDFTQANVFDDPEQRRRMRRLVAQERSTFGGGAAVDFARVRSGGISGLVQG